MSKSGSQPFPSAARDTDIVVDRIRRWMKESKISVRKMARDTAELEPPEVMHHSNLSMALKRDENRNLYLQQAMVLANVMYVPYAALFLSDDMSDAKNAYALTQYFLKLPRARRENLLETLRREATQADATGKRTPKRVT